MEKQQVLSHRVHVVQDTQPAIPNWGDSEKNNDEQRGEGEAVVSHLIGPLPRVNPQVDAERGGGGEILPTMLAVEGAGLGGRALGVRVVGRLAVGEDVLLQGGAGGEAPSAGHQGAAEGRLPGVGQPVEVQPLLRDAAVATHVTLQLPCAPAPPTPRLPQAALLVVVQQRLV